MAQFTIPSNNASSNAKDDVEWQNVEPSSLPKNLEVKYTKLRNAIEALAAAKADFESDFASACNVETGSKMIFSYRYGLACGVVPEKQTRGKGKVNFGSLAKKGK